MASTPRPISRRGAAAAKQKSSPVGKPWRRTRPRRARCRAGAATGTLRWPPARGAAQPAIPANRKSHRPGRPPTRTPARPAGRKAVPADRHGRGIRHRCRAPTAENGRCEALPPQRRPEVRGSPPGPTGCGPSSKAAWSGTGSRAERPEWALATNAVPPGSAKTSRRPSGANSLLHYSEGTAGGRCATLLHLTFRLEESRILYRRVVPGLRDLNREASVGPRQRPAERTFHAVHFAVIGVVDLGRVAAHWRLRVAHH